MFLCGKIYCSLKYTVIRYYNFTARKLKVYGAMKTVYLTLLKAVYFLTQFWLLMIDRIVYTSLATVYFFLKDPLFSVQRPYTLCQEPILCQLPVYIWAYFKATYFSGNTRHISTLSAREGSDVKRRLFRSHWSQVRCDQDGLMDRFYLKILNRR